MFLAADGVERLANLSEADAVVVDYGLAGASEYLRSRAAVQSPPAIALVGKGGPCRTVEQSLLLAEVDGATLALPKPAGPTDIAIAALQALDRTSPDDGWRLRLRELVKAYPR